jgi:CrcB protein
VTHALLVAAGGAGGALLRWAVTLALAPSPTSGIALPAFPWATLAVNVVGCACMGALASLTGPRDDARLLLGTGVLGGFTTFSAFGLETLTLLRAGAHGLAAANVLANVLLGVLMAAGGWKAAGG